MKDVAAVIRDCEKHIVRLCAPSEQNFWRAYTTRAIREALNRNEAMELRTCLDVLGYAIDRRIEKLGPL